MIARERVFIERAFSDGGGGHDSCDVNVGQTVGKVVNVDLNAISSYLTLDAGVAGSENLILNFV